MIFTIGEALIDFISEEQGIKLKNSSVFKKAAGGAPANVACAVAKLDGKSSFIGKLGYDAFGDYILDVMTDNGVNTKYVTRTHKANTALAFVSLADYGDREFLFYRNPGADMLLDSEDILTDWFSEGDILHFCSVGLVEAPLKYAHLKAIDIVRRKKGIISFDPNVRLSLWEKPTECRKIILNLIPVCDIIKISEDELAFITGIDNEAEAINFLLSKKVKIVLYTKGSKGAELHTDRFGVSVSGKPVRAIDTTGAGDAFIGAFLYKINDVKIDINTITEEQAIHVLEFANTVASITTTKVGAISSLPSIADL